MRLTDFDTPKRFKGRNGLQIFVDRFFRAGEKPKAMEGRILKEWSDTTPNWEPEADGVYMNNYFYGGNLQGIIAKLDYIRNNAFNLLYLSPISLSETSHHYEPTDQMQIDPWIGTWEDFEELCQEAHKRDILVTVDLVFNHMGSSSPIFREALRNPNSRYHNWFEWNERGNPIFWAGFDNMPQCNKMNEEYQDYACRVAELYMRMGADGIRIDLGENFPKEFMAKLRECVKSINPEAILVSEMWGLATKRENSQLDGEQVDSVMNYPLSDAIVRWLRFGNKGHFQYTVEELKKYPEQVQEVLWNFLDSHDTPRAVNMLVGDGILEDPFKGACWDIEGPWRHERWFDTYGFRRWENENDWMDIENARAILKAASAIQYFMPGIPVVFAGTEIGMFGYKDPFNRKPYNWEHADSKLLEHYRTLGEIRRKYYRLFEEGVDIQIEISEDTLEILRRKNSEELMLRVIRATDFGKSSRIEVFSRVY